MPNWLAKILPPAPPSPTGRKLPVKPGQGRQSQQTANHLPNAALIYGVAASILCVMAIFLVFKGRWVSGLLTLLPAGCFLGFALHFIRHPD
jgi:hypothetical protein